MGMYRDRVSERIEETETLRETQREKPKIRWREGAIKLREEREREREKKRDRQTLSVCVQERDSDRETEIE